MLTEEEARKKWCPFSRTTARGSGNAGSWNRFEDVEPPTMAGASCIASACMAWRWHEWADAWEDFKDEDGDRYMRRVKVTEPQVGYCGLAGTP